MLLVSTGLLTDVPKASAQTMETTLISRGVEGQPGDGDSPQQIRVSGPNVAISADGRYVAFSSNASNLLGVGRDENQATDVFRFDRETGEVILVSRGQRDGEPTIGDNDSGLSQIDISADGNLVVFDSYARNLTNAHVNAELSHIFVRDVRNEYTVLASTDGEIPRDGSTASISSNGRFVAFANDNLFAPVYRVELFFDEGGALYGAGFLTEVVQHGTDPAISADGRYVAFTTYDSLDERDAERDGDQSDVYLWDGDSRYSLPELISITPERGSSGDGPSYTTGPRALSDDARRVGFLSEAQNLLLGEVEVPSGRVAYVRVRSSEFASTRALPVTPEGDIRNSEYPQLSRDGAFAVFASNMGDLVDPPQGDQTHVYVRDLIVRDDGNHVITLASQSTGGAAGDTDSGDAVLSADGRVVAFGSEASNLDDDRNELIDVFVRAESIEEPIEGLALTVEPVSGPPGISDVDLSGVDISALPLVPGELEATPLRASPLRASPLRASPLRASPLRASPLRASPLRASPLRASPLRASPLRASPLRASPLPPMPLTTVPLLIDGGWSQLLEGTPLAGLPLQNVTLQDVLMLPEGLYPQIDALTLEDIDITSTPLAEASLQVFLFAGPFLDDLSATTDWCGELAADGFVCADHDITESDSDLLDLAFAGADVDALGFLPDLPVSGADLSGSPAAAYDIASVDVDATSLGALPVTSIPAGIVDCGNTAVFDCNAPGATLGGAVAAGAIVDAPTAVLGRILQVDSLVGGLTLGDVIRMLVDPAKLSYDDVPLVPLLLGEDIQGQLRYTASATVECSDADQLTYEVVLPAGFRYLSGSSSVTYNGLPGPDPGDPSFGEGHDPREAGPTTLTWYKVGTTRSCTDYDRKVGVALSFLADPWVELGTKTSSVTLTTPSGFAAVEDTAPFTVEDAHEPNDSADEPTAITSGELLLSHLGTGDQSDFFEVQTENGQPLERGSIVTAILGHLPADFDLRLDGPSIAPLRASPLRASPLRASPIEDPGLSVDPAGQAIGPDLVEDVPRGDDTLSQSASRGLETEVVSMIVPPSLDGEPFTLAVSSYLGASSDSPYTLQVMVEPPPELSCTPQTAFAAAGAPGSLPSVSSLDPGTRTLVLVNQQRFDALHGAGATQQVRDALAAAIPAGDEAGPFAVVPVDGDAAVRAAYGAWDADPCEPERANDVVRAAVAVTDTYAQALPDLRFVVVVGDDNIVPSYRVPDLTTLANQRDYYPELIFDGQDNPLSASAAYGYVLSDNAYTERDSIEWLDHELLVPDFAGGRLVESLPEILGTINRYATQKYLELDSSLVTAYDFLTDGGQDTQDLIAARADTPGNARSLISDSWTKSELLTELGLSPDLTSVWAHYDHSRLLTAAGDAAPAPGDEIATSTEALAAGLADGTLFFTLGCNAGLNVPALVSVGASPEEAERLLDWAQATAQRGGAFLGNTGFGYGDDVVSAYGERLMTLFADLLDGSMTIGQAAVAARQLYLEEAALDVYTDKTVASSTLYGLPFVRVGATGTVAPAPDDQPRPPAETGPVGPDPQTGQPSTAFTVEPTFDEITTERGQYHVAELGGRDEPTLKALYRPVQPAITLNLPDAPPGLTPGDLVITGLSTQDFEQPDPVFVRPTFDLSAHEPEPLVRDVAYPVSMGYVTPSGNLLLSAGQFRRHMLGEGTQTLYTRITGRVLYDAAGAPIDRPIFTTVEAHEFAGSSSTGFVVDVDQADLVFVLYKSSTSDQWKRVDLEVWPDGTWTGAVTDEVSEYFVQAVRGAGVASARGKGLNFQPSEEPLECPTFDQVRAELDGLVAAGGITEGLQGKIRHALNTAEAWLQIPGKRGPALSHLRRAVHLLLWQADVVEKGKDAQGDPVGLRALALSVRTLLDCQ